MSLGQVAYDAYGNARKWETFDGSPMPPWSSQNEELKAAWGAAAEAVLAAMDWNW